MRISAACKDFPDGHERKEDAQRQKVPQEVPVGAALGDDHNSRYIVSAAGIGGGRNEAAVPLPLDRVENEAFDAPVRRFYLFPPSQFERFLPGCECRFRDGTEEPEVRYAAGYKVLENASFVYEKRHRTAVREKKDDFRNIADRRKPEVGVDNQPDCTRTRNRIHGQIGIVEIPVFGRGRPERIRPGRKGGAAEADYQQENKQGCACEDLNRPT